MNLLRYDLSNFAFKYQSAKPRHKSTLHLSWAGALDHVRLTIALTHFESI